MGIPKFYRWVSERYPLVIQPIVQHALQHFDNLYLDVNGIIHTNSHPFEDPLKNILTTDQIAVACCKYLGLLVSTVRPRKLLYIAIDGVAPRAKMNQQRSRRFRTAKDNRVAFEEKQAAGLIPRTADRSSLFDSNCISPGTEFMAAITQHLKFFIAKKQTEDPLWREFRVIFSGQEVPGEGEHKIFQYMREQRVKPDWNPNQTHCLYGLDADLIVLGLLTHEHNVAILREESLSKAAIRNKKRDTPLPFQLLHLSLLREYLAMDLNFNTVAKPTPATSPKPAATQVEFNVENAIDDFGLLVALVGNDFLPCLPSMAIGEGGLNNLFDVYREFVPKAGGYLTDGARINTKRLAFLFRTLSQSENDAMGFPDIAGFDEVSPSKTPASSVGLVITDDNNIDEGESEVVCQFASPVITPHEIKLAGMDTPLRVEDEEEEDVSDLVDKLDQVALGDDEEEEEDEDFPQTPTPPVGLEFHPHVKASMPDEDAHWRELYYTSKFKGQNATLSNTDFHVPFRREYLNGLAWVLRYYHEGCCSWSWFFPYHYAPCLSDLIQAVEEWQEPEFELSAPLPPLTQLMGVLPPDSMVLLPEPYRWLMCAGSPVKDYYPDDFSTDANDSKNSWEAIVLIPFIDVKRLQATITLSEQHRPLSPADRARNVFDSDLLFTYQPTVTPHHLASSMPTIIPDLCECFSHMVSLEPSPLLPRPAPGQAKRHRSTLQPMVPTLTTLQYRSAIKNVGVLVHMGKSRNPSILLTIQPTNKTTTLEQSARLLGRSVWINWPYLWEAKVGTVADKDCNISLASDNSPVRRPHTDRNWWIHETLYQRREIKGRKAVEIDDIQVIMEVYPLEGFIVRPDGSRIKCFSEVPVMVPAQLVLESAPASFDVWPENGPLPVSKLYPQGEFALFLTPPHTGSVAQILSANKVCVKDSVIKPDVGYAMNVAGHQPQESWFNMSQAARSIGCYPTTVIRATCHLFIQPIRADVGLVLRVPKESLQLIGWSRHNASNNQWELSRRAVETLAEYRSMFPEVFNMVDRNPDTATYQIEDLVPNDPTGMMGPALVSRITAWLKTKDTGAKLVPFGSMTLNSLGIHSIDTVVQKALKEHQQQPALTMDVNMAAIDSCPLVRPIPVTPIPLHAELPLAAVQLGLNGGLVLGSRVANLYDDGLVPFGATGTVIALKGTSVEIMWDQPLFAGTDLGGTCPQYRGVARERRFVLLINQPLNVKAPPPPQQQQQQQRRYMRTSNEQQFAQPPPRVVQSPYRAQQQPQQQQQQQQQQRSPFRQQQQQPPRGGNQYARMQAAFETEVNSQQQPPPPPVAAGTWQQEMLFTPTPPQQQQQAARAQPFLNKQRAQSPTGGKLKIMRRPEAFPAPGLVTPPIFSWSAPETANSAPQQRPPPPIQPGLSPSVQQLFMAASSLATPTTPSASSTPSDSDQVLTWQQKTFMDNKKQ